MWGGEKKQPLKERMLASAAESRDADVQLLQVPGSTHVVQNVYCEAHISIITVSTPRKLNGIY